MASRLISTSAAFFCKNQQSVDFCYHTCSNLNIFINLNKAEKLKLTVMILSATRVYATCSVLMTYKTTI